MAQFRIALNSEITQAILENLEAIRAKQHRGELPEYPQFVRNLMKDGDTPGLELLHACVGASGEAGETLDLAKKVYFYDKSLDVDKLIEEMGDQRFYYQALLNLLGLRDEDIVAENMRKLSIRYASGKFSKEQANARADKDPGARSFIGQPEQGVAQPLPPRYDIPSSPNLGVPEVNSEGGTHD